MKALKRQHKKKKTLVVNILRNMKHFEIPTHNFLKCEVEGCTSPNSICIFLDAFWSEFQKRIYERERGAVGSVPCDCLLTGWHMARFLVDGVY